MASSTAEPLGEQRIEQEWLAVNVALDMPFVDKESLESLLEGGTGDPVLPCDDSASRSLTIGESEKDQTLGSTNAVPERLVCITRFGERELNRSGGNLIRTIRLPEQVV